VLLSELHDNDVQHTQDTDDGVTERVAVGCNHRSFAKKYEKSL
jgi:hypothetical protein